MKQIIFCTLLLLLLPIVYAFPPGSAPAGGGNVTLITIFGGMSATDWQGYTGIMTYGIGPTTPTTVNATGSNVTGQGFHLQTICNNPVSITGFILFSNSSAAPIGLTAGNLSKLDAVIPGPENGTLTFCKTSMFNFPSAGAVNNVPTTNTFVNELPQNTSFREGYLNDAAGNIIFATEINFVPIPGYNQSSFTYQVMLAAPNYSTVPYYIFSDLNVQCPVPPGPAAGGGGGSAGRFCTEQWQCDDWGPCIDGVQRRTCRKTRTCPTYSSNYEPPTEMKCGEYKPERPEYQQEIKEEKITFDDLFKNIELIVPEKLEAIIMQTKSFEAKVQNKNDISLENMNIKMDFPERISNFLPIHQYKTILWNALRIGWQPRPFKQNIYNWQTITETPFKISPGEMRNTEVQIISPPMLPQEVPATISLFMGERIIKTKPIQIQTKTQEFDAGYVYNPETNRLSLFFIVENTGKPAKENAFIEFNLGTELVELFGPYKIPAGQTIILAQEYALSPKLAGKQYEMKAKLYSDKIIEVNKKCIISE